MPSILTPKAVALMTSSLFHPMRCSRLRLMLSKEPVDFTVVPSRPGRSYSSTRLSHFDRFAETWRLDSDTASMNEESRDSFEDLRRKIMRAIQAGQLTVDDTGDTLTYTLGFPKTDGIAELTIRVPMGAALIAWDKFKERQAIHRLNSYMASMCRTNPAVFSAMDQRDLKIVQAVAQLFLGS